MEKVTEKEKQAIFLVRLAMELNKSRKPSILVNGRYR
jgi:hypothetical protein